MSFRHGDKVVCINDVFTMEQIEMIPNRPVLNETYQVDEVLVTRMGRAVTLVEINNPPLQHPSGLGTFEPSFATHRFRKVEEIEETQFVEEEAFTAA